jgi:hypothetical protein
MIRNILGMFLVILIFSTVSALAATVTIEFDAYSRYDLIDEIRVYNRLDSPRVILGTAIPTATEITFETVPAAAEWVLVPHSPVWGDGPDSTIVIAPEPPPPVSNPRIKQIIAVASMAAAFLVMGGWKIFKWIGGKLAFWK